VNANRPKGVEKNPANISGSSFYKPAMPPTGRRSSSKMGTP
jgi:hypothetical protein